MRRIIALLLALLLLALPFFVPRCETVAMNGQVVTLDPIHRYLKRLPKVRQKAAFSFDHRALAPKWMKEAIDRDLAHFSSYSLQDLHATLEHLSRLEDDFTKLGIVYFRIRNHKVYLADFTDDHPRAREYAVALQNLAWATRMKDCDFLLTVEDTLFFDELPLPIFAFCKLRSNSTFLLVPDNEAVRGYRSIDDQVKEGDLQCPWENKEQVGYWRGCTNGGLYQSSEWKSYQRPKLVFHSLEHPTLVDARFTCFAMGASENREILAQEKALKAPFASIKTALRYRYQIDVDGNASTYSRTYWTLLSESLLIKQESPYIQWYYDQLQPGVHYLDFDRECANLNEKIEWAKQHDHEAKQIAQQGSIFAKEALNTDAIFQYLYHAICAYQAKMMSWENNELNQE